MTRAYLVLENGRIFEGESFGAAVETIGELVFNTGVVGYVEMLTDPASYGQILLNTFPVMGNYGWIEADQESAKCHLRGMVVREWSDAPSNFRAGVTLDAYLKKEGIAGVCGVDTRELTQIIREAGTMGAMITTVKPESIPDEIRSYRVQNAVSAVSCTEKKVYAPSGIFRSDVVLIDYGTKKSVIDCLLSLNCRVTVVPYNTSAEEILALSPDGVVLSDGPGDPADEVECVKVIGKLFGKLPILGIGLGHQMLALAAGGSTQRLGHGHHGANQPARECATGRVLITEQNHGYTVVTDPLEAKGAVVSYENVNDGSCEGLEYPEKNAFSLQFQPTMRQDRPNPEFGFEKFVAMMGGRA